jgi:hypothetical protein
VAALSLLPIANLIPGGERDPAYADRMLDWLNGTALCAVVGLLVAYVARTRRADRSWLGAPDARDGAAGAAIDQAGPDAPSGPDAGAPAPGSAFLASLAACSFILYALTARFVLSAKPLLIDEIVQVLQARWYAAGQLSVPTPELPEFFAIMHVVESGGRLFGQFPPGGPAMLAIGTLLGAEWLVGPAAGAVSVALFGATLPSIAPFATRRWLRGTTMLFAFAPFGVFMFASHMNHATTLMWLMVALFGLSRCTGGGMRSPWWGLLAGLGLGMAATIRPLDALSFALPAGAWLAWRTKGRGRAVAMLVLSGVGVAVPVAAMMVVNARTTGAPLLFGYDVLWGANHSLGFHEAPWGPPHTPARGLELIGLYFSRLGTYLLESPVPGTLLVAVGLWTTRRLSSLDRFLLASGALLVAGYWAYWHDGFFLGPRFLFALLPALIIWSARGIAGMARVAPPGNPAGAGLRAAGATALLLTAVSLAFIRVPSYRNGLTSMRFDIEGSSTRAGVQDALVLVKESWGARVVVRMWALGIPHPVAERIYRNSDICRLELRVRELESMDRARLAPSMAERALLALIADSTDLVRSTATTGFTESVRANAVWPAECLALRAADESGTSHLAPFLLVRDGNVYARWLPGREAEIAKLHPERPVYRLDRAGPAPDAALVWRRIEVPDR